MAAGASAALLVLLLYLLTLVVQKVRKLYKIQTSPDDVGHMQRHAHRARTAGHVTESRDQPSALLPKGNLKAAPRNMSSTPERTRGLTFADAAAERMAARIRMAAEKSDADVPRRGSRERLLSEGDESENEL